MQALSGHVGPKECYLLHMRLMMLSCGGYGAGFIVERHGVSSGSLPHFLCGPGDVAGRLGSLVERHLSNLDSNTSPFILTAVPLLSCRSSRR